MSLRILLAMIWLVPCLGWSQGLVGNGGEGILDQGEIYVRDLYERDLHLDPYFGTSISPAIQAEYKEPLSLGLTKEQNELLLSKLTDIEARKAGLGVLFARAFAAYSWFLERESLGLLPEEEVIRHFPDDRRVQLANRSVQSIRIHRGSWEKLSDHSRIALIMHEIVYSLMPVESLGNGHTQSLSMTREIVALLFQRPLEGGSQQAQNSLIARGFGLREGPLVSHATIEPIELILFNGSENSPRKQVVTIDPSGSESIQSGLEKFCRLYERTGDRKPEYIYEFRSARSFPVELLFKRYQMWRQGQSGPLDVLEIRYPTDYGFFQTCGNHEFWYGKSCQQLLKTQISLWLGPGAARHFDRCDRNGVPALLTK